MAETETKDKPKPTLFDVKIYAQRDFVMELSLRDIDMEGLTLIEDKLQKLGFNPVKKEKTEAEKFEEEMETAHAQPTQQQGPNNQLNNMQGDKPICPLHNRPMDRVTSKGVPYHSYQGKNCSGEGWWGSRNSQN